MSSSSSLEYRLSLLFRQFAMNATSLEAPGREDNVQSLEAALVQCLSQAEGTKRSLAEVELQRLQSPSLNVAVIATMSAGKSTLLNALLGTALLPSSVEATTAKIISIEDCDGMSGFSYEAKDAQGISLKKGIADRDSLRALNTEDAITSVHLKGDITWVDNDITGKVILFDTPGPNAFQEKGHRNRFEQYLTQSDSLTRPDLVLYVMDATKLQVEDDHQLLSSLIDNLSTLHLGFGQLYFVVNKIDQLDAEMGESVLEMVESIRCYLQNSFEIPSPKIIPVSAMVGLLTQKKLTGQSMTKKDKRQLRQFLGCFTSDVAKTDILPTLSRYLSDKDSSEKDELRLLYQRSGIQQLQVLIRTYLKQTSREMRQVQAGLWLWNNNVMVPNAINERLSNLIARHFS